MMHKDSQSLMVGEMAEEEPMRTDESRQIANLEVEGDGLRTQLKVANDALDARVCRNQALSLAVQWSRYQGTTADERRVVIAAELFDRFLRGESAA